MSDHEHHEYTEDPRAAQPIHHPPTSFISKYIILPRHMLYRGVLPAYIVMRVCERVKILHIILLK